MSKLNQRHIDIDGMCNLRELSGYSSNNGRVIGCSRLWRSDSPHLLNDAGIEQLQAAGLVAVIDLRDAVELERAPNPFEKNRDVEYHHIPLLAKLDAMAPFSLVAEDGTDPLLSMYCDIVTTRQPALASALSVLANAPRGLVLVHCTVGKDRTGVFIALVLAMLGLPQQAIAEDYSLSAARIAPFMQRIISQFVNSPAEAENILPLFASVPHTMLNMFEYIQSHYGSVQSYLRLLDSDGELQKRLRLRLLS
jgi:protein-tyrosine phosphatase